MDTQRSGQIKQITVWHALIVGELKNVYPKILGMDPN